MSTFGNDLIERLRTRLVDVRRQDELGQRVDRGREEIWMSSRTRKRGERTSRLSCASLCQGAVKRPSVTILLSLALNQERGAAR
jgi:hypothetical protein